MKPVLAFYLMVLLSEVTQWAVWKLGNQDKQWREWLKMGIPHFLANVWIVILVEMSWYHQVLGDWIAFGLTFFHINTTQEWQRFLSVDPVTGAVMGFGADKFGDQVGRLLQLIWGGVYGRIRAVFQTPKSKEE